MSPQRPTVDKMQKDKEAVEAELADLQDQNDFFKSLLARFFAFQIEESELRKSLAPHIPNVNAFLRSPAVSRRATVARAPLSPGMAERSPEAQLYKRASMAEGPMHRKSLISLPTSPMEDGREPEEAVPVNEAALPQLQAPGLRSVAYRIRGKKEEEAPAFRQVVYEKDDEEERVIQNLKEAQKRLLNHMKLQVISLSPFLGDLGTEAI